MIICRWLLSQTSCDPHRVFAWLLSPYLCRRIEDSMRKGCQWLMMGWVLGLFLGCEPKERKLLDLSQLSYEQLTPELIAQCTKALRDNPIDPYWRYHRSLLYHQTGQHRRARQDIEQAIKANSSQGKYYFLRAQIESALGLGEAATRSAQLAEVNGYAFPDLHLLMGKQFFQSGEYASAEISFKKFRSQVGDAPEVNYYLGKIYQVRNDTAKAFDFYRRVLADQPGHEPTLADLLEYYHRNLDVKASANVLSRIDELGNTKSARLLYEIGRSYQMRSKPDTAYLYFEKAINADPTLWQASYQLALKRLSENDYINAERLLINALDQNPAIVGGYMQLGWIYEYADINLAQAREAYAMAIEHGDAKAEIALNRIDRKLGRPVYTAPKPAKPKLDTVVTSRLRKDTSFLTRERP